MSSHTWMAGKPRIVAINDKPVQASCARRRCQRRVSIWLACAAGVGAACAWRQPGVPTFVDVGVLSPFRLFGLLPSTDHLCAVEGTRCSCIGVATLHSPFGKVIERRVNQSIACKPDFFGADPQPNIPKYCTCRSGPAWPAEVVKGFEAMASRSLVPRIEIGPATAGCSAEDDGQWTACAVMSTSQNREPTPERLMTSLETDLYSDMALRKLDSCFHLAGPAKALRVLGVWDASPAKAMELISAAQAPVCAVVYSPQDGGALWQKRDTIFCPTEPPHCLEEHCVCADPNMRPVNIHTQEATTECWACRPEVAQQESRSDA
mmetsp:Transcript_26607/g.48756  ORF Transcript_26607/g.48756 Transcript_26607/m.48756 type:complete len:320 (+) Transcript_26607:47-1006(+)